MRSEIEAFKQDLLKSIKQMRRGQAVRITRVKVPKAGRLDGAMTLSYPKALLESRKQGFDSLLSFT